MMRKELMISNLTSYCFSSRFRLPIFKHMLEELFVQQLTDASLIATIREEIYGFCFQIIKLNC